MASSKQAAAAQPGGEAHTGDPARRCTAPMPPKPPPPTSHNKSVGCQPHPHSGMAPALASMDDWVSSGVCMIWCGRGGAACAGPAKVPLAGGPA